MSKTLFLTIFKFCCNSNHYCSFTNHFTWFNVDFEPLYYIAVSTLFLYITIGLL